RAARAGAGRDDVWHGDRRNSVADYRAGTDRQGRLARVICAVRRRGAVDSGTGDAALSQRAVSAGSIIKTEPNLRTRPPRSHPKRDLLGIDDRFFSGLSYRSGVSGSYVALVDGSRYIGSARRPCPFIAGGGEPDRAAGHGMGARPVPGDF